MKEAAVVAPASASMSLVLLSPLSFMALETLTVSVVPSAKMTLAWISVDRPATLAMAETTRYLVSVATASVFTTKPNWST